MVNVPLRCYLELNVRCADLEELIHLMRAPSGSDGKMFQGARTMFAMRTCRKSIKYHDRDAVE